MKPVPERKSEWSSLIAAVFIALFLLPTLWFPLHRDAGTFALGGLSVARGETLYRDFWDNKPPAIFWTYALPARFFPTQFPAAIYALNALILAISAELLSRLMRALGREVAASGAALWLVVLTLQPGFSNLAQAETFANCAVLGAALWAVSDEKKVRARGYLGCLAREFWRASRRFSSRLACCHCCRSYSGAAAICGLWDWYLAAARCR